MYNAQENKIEDEKWRWNEALSLNYDISKDCVISKLRHEANI